MMSTINLNDIIPKLIKCFPLEDYLKEVGYKYNPSSDIKHFKSYILLDKNNKTEDLLFISFILNTYYFYSYKNKDHGNSVEFFKNRIDKNEAITSTTSIIEACKKMFVFMTEKGIDNALPIVDFNNEINKNELFHFLQTPFTSFFNLNTLHDFSYFNSLGVDDTSLKHKLFEGTVYNSSGLGVKGKTLNIINTCFIMYDSDEKECGI
ncbi:hypothetical protein, partial [Tenacibaculum ovolyticum]|uniref:hypothetical protein n=1 Tax=Tenacibaculum ovolyticum TaxID=104270 RepID=UPI000B1AE1F8